MKIKLLSTLLAILSCTMSFAQFKQEKNQTTKWDSFYIQYNSIVANYQTKKADELALKGLKNYSAKKYIEECLNDKMSGMTVGYSHITRVFPIWLEYGGALQYGWYSNSRIYSSTSALIVKAKLSMLTLTAPVNVLYNYQIPNSNISLEPKVGLYFRYNIYGQINAEEFAFDTTDKRYNNIFDKNYYGKHIQIGWNAGFNIVYKRIFIGISYCNDISKIYDGYADVKLNQTSVTAGFRF